MLEDLKPQFITPEHFAAFGRVMQAFVSVETLYAYIVATILQIDFAKASIAFSQYNYEPLKNILKTCLSESNMPQPVVTGAIKLMDKIGDKSALRNNIAHNAWRPGKRPQSIKPMVLRTKGALFILGVEHNEKDWTAEELNAEADEILSRAFKFGQFLKDAGLPFSALNGAD